SKRPAYPLPFAEEDLPNGPSFVDRKRRGFVDRVSWTELTLSDKTGTDGTTTIVSGRIRISGLGW
ncbi:MAG: hypothetical protein QOJ51_5719, partial [Acidobacteriaceae bacterium]|nr:hypothetical protein [Acidobacteriaceae bacterium]